MTAIHGRYGGKAESSPAAATATATSERAAIAWANRSTLARSPGRGRCRCGEDSRNPDTANEAINATVGSQGSSVPSQTAPATNDVTVKRRTVVPRASTTPTRMS